MSKRLIINADDLGYSVGITDGILQAHRRGILTSATLMATMPDCLRAIELSKETPGLGVGIHLCLTEGTSRAGLKAGGLLGANGTFPRKLPALTLRLATSARARREARDEWTAQISYALEHGVKITHLDSHRHIHHLPQLMPVVLDLAQQFGIKYVRCAVEAQFLQGSALQSGRGKAGYRALTILARRLKKRLHARGLASTDWFFGLATTGKTDSGVWQQILPRVPDGVGEVMVHPGDPAGLTTANTRLLAERTLEQNALCDPAVGAAVKACGIELTHYGRL